MGPRLFRRGNTSQSIAVSPSIGGFNGATSFQTWKYLDAFIPNIFPNGFNGATSFQTWK